MGFNSITAPIKDSNILFSNKSVSYLYKNYESNSVNTILKNLPDGVCISNRIDNKNENLCLKIKMIVAAILLIIGASASSISRKLIFNSKSLNQPFQHVWFMTFITQFSIFLSIFIFFISKLLKLKKEDESKSNENKADSQLKRK